MKSLFLICCALFMLNSATAQAEQIIQFTDLETAKAYAFENKQDILMVFAGSDWCKPCIQFKKDILLSTDFKFQMKDKLIVLYLDFPARRKNKLSKEQNAHNEALAGRYNKSGAFPKIILLDSQENILAIPTFTGQTALDFSHSLATSLTFNQ